MYKKNQSLFLRDRTVASYLHGHVVCTDDDIRKLSELTAKKFRLRIKIHELYVNIGELPRRTCFNDGEGNVNFSLQVFRRADKNDDGAISWEEFVGFFADGVMGKEELQSLFKEIDTHNSGNIDTGELCDYFSQHLGEFKEIYRLVEDLNQKITNVLMTTSQKYPSAPSTEKFVTRFLMREVINQISALQRPLESASDVIDEQARQERTDVKPLEPADLSEKPGFIPGRVVRRARRQVSQGSTLSEGMSTKSLDNQVERLANLLDRMEHRVNFNSFIDEDLNATNNEKYLLLQRDMQIMEEKFDDFRTQLRDYIENTNNADGCLSTSVRYYQDTSDMSFYEVWECANKQKSYTSKPDASFANRFKNFIKESSDMDTLSSGLQDFILMEYRDNLKIMN
ncbi:hypothetical protein KUTeg_019728 [Tegillarca granosa]|uniref:EF-hand domain-containing protein n=1 Tax=Tegillarca granosa TaxID=220873 RepID=A0ABQ9EHD9_TEGGR|nr:hypothetical protein KUTeg_019728 [Tegillarca granosa]